MVRSVTAALCDLLVDNAEAECVIYVLCFISFKVWCVDGGERITEQNIVLMNMLFWKKIFQA